MYDGLGWAVVRLNLSLPAGSHVMPADARGWPVGVYTFRLVANEQMTAGHLTLLR